MDENVAYNIFVDFHKDLPKNMIKLMTDIDYNGYYTVVTQIYYNPSRPLYHSKDETKYFSFKELYEEMCDLFYQFDDGNENIVHDIIHLKNFINLKIIKEGKKHGTSISM